MKPIWVKAWVSTWYVSCNIEFLSSPVLVLALMRRFRTKSMLVVSRYGQLDETASGRTGRFDPLAVGRRSGSSAQHGCNRSTSANRVSCWFRRPSSNVGNTGQRVQAASNARIARSVAMAPGACACALLIPMLGLSFGCRFWWCRATSPPGR